MEQVSPLLEAFDYLDIVLALVGALTVSLLFGRGKNIWGIMSGALMGGLVKPAIFLFVVGGAFVAVQQGQDTPMSRKTQAEQDRIVKFWTEPHAKRH